MILKIVNIETYIENSPKNVGRILLKWLNIVKNTPLKKHLLHIFGLSNLLRKSGWHLDPLMKGIERDQGHWVVLHDQEEDYQQAMTFRSRSTSTSECCSGVLQVLRPM